MIDKSWIPDWRDENAYPKPKDLSYRYWAWEFLRRNPEYQKACDLIPLNLFERGKEFFFIWSNWSKEQLTEMLYNKNKNCKLPYYLIQYFKITSGEFEAKHPNEINSIAPQWCIDFGVKMPDHYSQNHPLILFSSENEEPIEEKNLSSTNLPNSHTPSVKTVFNLKKNQAIVTVDLSAPINPQILSIRKNLHHLLKVGNQEKNLAKNRKIEEYPKYIRILDAHTAGASPKEIATVFFPGEKNDSDNEYRLSKQIKNDRLAALKLRDGGYKSLPSF